jgi:hypothetical protein
MLNKNIDLEFSAHDAFLESYSSSTLKTKKRLARENDFKVIVRKNKQRA